MTQTREGSEEWDMVIQPTYGWFDLKLRDVWRYRDLLMILVYRDFVAQYKQTILGPLWFFIQPIITSFTFLIIFGKIAKIETGETIPQPLFYLSGVILWGYFSECLIKTSTVFRGYSSVFGKVYFPRLIVPLSIVVSNLIRFGIQILLFLAVYLFYVFAMDYRPQLSYHLLLLPVMILLMAILGLSLGMIISAMTTKYRDLSFLVAFGVQLFMYATPIIYPLSTLSDKARGILQWNPMATVVEGMRKGLFNEGLFSWGYLAYAFGLSLLLLFVGIVIFNRVEKSFVDTV